MIGRHNASIRVDSHESDCRIGQLVPGSRLNMGLVLSIVCRQLYEVRQAAVPRQSSVRSTVTDCRWSDNTHLSY